eukprot:CAMPEP_0175074224 /NCGR_PEP_ID=MMETSP0052_2-20121109/21156_1 /TAXON_ID=51329 ORGANISM="Polytomella parva, Strain SAG 63-3" /NCGR_SAMPLE_ID=MMETSP0052_2 /ASSEMBLY_ACC=CAM_ASM_000194 /LENGTH=35 /DNA_ID= /DNA_START= /DNA_END= /DNA_ORIENTATION=
MYGTRGVYGIEENCGTDGYVIGRKEGEESTALAFV